jgi:hypothetical protein
MISGNASSSRAIPFHRSVKEILEDPWIPDFEKNKGGMQSDTPLTADEQFRATEIWLSCRDKAVETAQHLADQNGLNIHKQYVNRLLEPFGWITNIYTATDWDNFFAQRHHPAAFPPLRKLAGMMYDAYEASTPVERDNHIPMTDDLADVDVQKIAFLAGDLTHIPNVFNKRDGNLIAVRMAISAGRCAAISYDNLGEGMDPVKDLNRFKKLVSAVPGHWSPMEHQAFAVERENYLRPHSNLAYPWWQFRKMFPNENITDFKRFRESLG